MRATVLAAELPKDRRVIAVSDIHGDFDLFKRLLSKAEYTSDDTLVIVGDFLERGPKNLETLRYVMELSRRDNVYVLLGNNDALYEHYMRSGVRADELISYIINRENTALREMCAELKMDTQTDAEYMRREIERSYGSELNWLCGLPVILDTPHCTFVHAGLEQGSLYEQNRSACIRTEAFLSRDVRFDRFTVVGHWPVVNYNEKYLCCNPVVDRQKNIISIDGGNQIKRFGQLNALIFPHPASKEVSFVSCDDLPTGIVPISQEAAQESTAIVWGRNAVRIIEKKPPFVRCESIDSGRELCVPDSFFYQMDGADYIADYSDYRLPVEAGDEVSVIGRWGEQMLVKRDGNIGWYTGEIRSITNR